MKESSAPRGFLQQRCHSCGVIWIWRPAPGDLATGHVLGGLGIWLLFFPQWIHLWHCVCELTQARPASSCWEVAKNAAIVLALSIPLLVEMATMVFVEGYSGLHQKTEAWHRYLTILNFGEICWYVAILWF